METPGPLPLEERIRDLESKVSRLTMAVIIALLLGVGAGLIAGVILMKNRGRSLNVQNVRLVDERGRLLAELGKDDAGRPAFRMLDPEDGHITWRTPGPQIEEEPGATEFFRPKSTPPPPPPSSSPLPHKEEPQPGNPTSPPTQPPQAKTDQAATPPPSQLKPGNPPSKIIVYISKSGKKYHTEKCRFVSSHKTPISLEEAKKKGYTPCSICNPPK